VASAAGASAEAFQLGIRKLALFVADNLLFSLRERRDLDPAGYPLSPDGMRWQLDFLAGAAATPA
jgi:hypothetical protein